MLYLAEFFSPFYLTVCGMCLGFIVGGLVVACFFLASEQKEFPDIADEDWRKENESVNHTTYLK